MDVRMSPNENNFVTVYKAHGRLDGESIKAFLEAQGIEAYLDQDALGSIYGLTVGDLGEVGVMVRKSDQAKAKELLNAMENGEFINEVLVDDHEPDSEEARKMEDKRKRVLILCTGNSCRSQMAEAIVNTDLAREWIAISAGSKPSGYIHPIALKVIADAGIEYQGYSKSVDEFKDQEFDMVITLCDAAREACPLWLKQGPIIHLGFADPSLFEGTDEQKYPVFKETFEAIRATIVNYLSDYDNVDWVYDSFGG